MNLLRFLILASIQVSLLVSNGSAQKLHTHYFGEEFNNGQTILDNWDYETGVSVNGWGNRELQNYTNSPNNARIVNGNLNIVIRKEANGQYTSARLISKKTFRYGTFEIRAQMPRGLGTWGMIWLLGYRPENPQWPLDGEIDIVEHVFFELDRVHATIHCDAFNHVKRNAIGASRVFPGATTGFLTYKLDWQPTFIRIFVNNVQIFEYLKPSPNANVSVWPYDREHRVILNAAYGGNWGGMRGLNDSALPTTQFVDYFRYWPLADNITRPPFVEQTPSIPWRGNEWAFACDWRGVHVQNRTATSFNECNGMCWGNPQCSHYTYNKYVNGGTCFMRRNGGLRDNAILTSDYGFICGLLPSRM